MRCTKILITLFLFLSLTRLQAQEIQHPLDPLTWQEYWTVLEVLREAEHLDEDTRFSMVNLKEPSKDFVLQWSPGDPISRSAFALVRNEDETHEAVIDLVERRLSSWTELEGLQPNWLDEEFSDAEDTVKEHPDFIEAMKLRGIQDFTFIDCTAVPPGYFGTEEQQDRRIAYVDCVDVRGVRNIWTRRIEGLTVVVDLDEDEVLRVVDEGPVPMSEISADYDRRSIGEPRKVPGPIRIEQPFGTGFRLKAYEVEWQKWRFHIRPDQRVGMVISMVSYDDDGEQRDILYQAHLSEIFVPYMDPSFAFYARNLLDAGEYSAGGLSKPLLKGLDSPDHAVYLDGLIAGDNGRPKTVPRTIAIFERETGDMAWRHWDEVEGEGASESRVKRDLVVRTAVALGNYDYIFDWIFQQNGSIRVAVGATGIAEVKTVPQPNALNHNNTETPDAYGRFVDRQIVAVNHSHYFNFRIDLDVDGQSNSLQIDRLKTKTLPEQHPRRSVWVSEPILASRESEAKLNIDLNNPSLWRVLSSSKTNHVGYPTSYQLMPNKNTNSLLSVDDYPRQRAGFINHHLWVTPYRQNELYAAGDYPTLSKPGYGLPEWTSENRSIENTDIVLWYTMGMHHMVRAEDWPVMPVLWHGFELRPFDFFDRNPALDLP